MPSNLMSMADGLPASRGIDAMACIKMRAMPFSA